MSNVTSVKKKITLTVVISGATASLELRQFPGSDVINSVMSRPRTGSFTDANSTDQTCQHLADGISELSKKYQIVMPALYQQSLIKRGLLAANIVEAATVFGYESTRLDSVVSASSSVNANGEPKAMKKSDMCRAIMTEHLHTTAEDVIAMIAEQCSLPAGLAKKYYLNNLGKVTIPQVG